MAISKIKMRLSAKFILFISMLIVFTSMILSMFFIRHETAEHIKNVGNRGKSLARHLAYNSEYGVLIASEEMLLKLIKGVVKEEDVVYAIIQDKNGNILAQAEAAAPIKIPEETRKIIAKEALKAEEALVQSYKVKKESLYDIANPIITRQVEKGREEIELFPDVVDEKGIERKIGVARIGISLARMNEQINRSKKIISLLTLAFISVGIIGTILFIRRLVRPIKQLVLGTERIANGDLNQTIEIQSEDEIGDLAHSFNRMAVNLKKRTEELQQSYALLDEKNKALAKERGLLRTLIDNLPDCYIFVKNTESQFITTNAAHLMTLGAKTLDEVIGKTDFDLFPRELAEQYYADEQTVIRSGQPLVNREELVIDSAGNRRWFLTTKVPLRDSSSLVVGIVGISKDITDLKAAYALLDAKNKELESFVYTVSHDLKAPLVSLEGFASMLLDNYRETLDETGQLYLSRIQANVQKMGCLIQDLLELSRIGRMVNSHESVDVTEIIQEVIETLQIQLSERGTKLVVQDNLPTIRCDKVRMKQVFENLISNANKFMGDENDRPRIEIGFHDKGDFFEFFVKDNGVGIQEEYREKVFEVFARLGDVEVEGTGVGLAIVKKIVETHGGKIWIDSEVSTGTTVYFTLPKSLQSNHAYIRRVG